MSRKKKWFWTLFSLGLAVLSIWGVMSQSKKWSLAGILESLRNADPLWLGAAVLCTALFIVLEAVALSVLGVLTPTTGALVHNAGSCFVVLLAALLYDRRYRP